MGAVQEPDGVALTKVYPAGNTSLTITAVAALGPLLTTERVNVTFDPTTGAALLTVLVIARSVAAVGTGVEVLLLLVGVGSVWFPEMVAVLAYTPVDLTVATTVRVALALSAKLPMFQLGALQVPVEGVALTKVYPVGKLSTTLTPVAANGPLLVAVMVKVTLLPITGVALFTTLLMDKSVAATGTGVFVLELLFVLGSYCVPVIVAVLA